MTLEEIKNILTGIQGFTNKVAYWAFPERAAPTLPFICFYEHGYDSMSADGINFYNAKQITVELYTENKLTETESKVETALTSAELFYTKSEEWLESEECWMITYEIEV